MPKAIIEQDDSVGAQFEMFRHRALTNERAGFVDGLFEELQNQLQRYLHEVHELARLTGRIEILEQNLQATRDLIHAQLKDTDEDTPDDWEKTLGRVRFVGLRLGDACVQLLKENNSLSTDHLRRLLDNGQFRFRTGFPLREINAALLRHPHISRDEDIWSYNDRPVKRSVDVTNRASRRRDLRVNRRTAAKKKQTA